MPTLHLHDAALVTATGPERGPLKTWDELGLFARADLIVSDDAAGRWQTTWIGRAGDQRRPTADTTVDLGGRLLMPGLCDCHTHLIFGGERSSEFTQRLGGRSYADIAAAGGGIVHTVAQTRGAGAEVLQATAAARLEELCAWGVRVVEIKTGYGLDVTSEVQILHTIAGLRDRFAGRLSIIATAMPGHAVPAEYTSHPSAYVDVVCRDILPAMFASGVPVQYMDVFIERGYFSVEDAARMWSVAKDFGWGLKAHVDEFADMGGLEWAVDRGACSVEHLLRTGARGIARLAAADTVAVCLPLTSLFLREPMAPMRDLVDAGARVALATDCNPGSAMSTNLVLAMQMAVLQGGLTPPEALRATTRNAAIALGEPDGWRGRIAIGEPFVATALDLEGPDDLFYRLGLPPCAMPTPETRLIFPRPR